MTRIGYVRTSTNKQNTDRQVNDLKACCDKVLIEDGVSARKRNRPVFHKMLGELNSGDEIVVTSFDRAFRSVIDGLISLDMLTNMDVTLISLTQKLDLRTPDGRLFFTLTIAVGEWEVNNLALRTVHGLKAARRRGKTLGRPRKHSDPGRDRTAVCDI